MKMCRAARAPEALEARACARSADEL